ncbi:hypothetical protein F441_19540 [Phytophthora nicotianae CJ01A1]|uniref:Uncharacterized protein n=2 Tax=Phytophthora nicotianae TaxID=4792 RepID=W2J751_PHYNI|nr:hypothetical protein L915_19142 [Phytophthora nicotianae]ETL41567.1 hypothetical protein L916_07497 [Phytophthora nicotianae]ETP03502.1 hypothetical protein F441_19540 [Phytophthora nicotianae CJ01A1]
MPPSGHSPTPATLFGTTMARTHKTAMVKAQMTDKLYRKKRRTAKKKPGV